MKLDAPKNANYAASVVRLPVLRTLENSDNLLGASLHGFQAIVDKSHNEGDLGIVFPAETQLSDEYCKYNSLYRHAEKNKDETAKGYLEDSRRVRAIKLRGNRSDCLFMPLSSLSFALDKSTDLKVGDTFDTLNGHEICKKYVIRTKASSNQQKQVKKFVRVDPLLFPEHVDSENYWRNSDKIKPEREIIVTQKLHGTSARFTNTKVLRKLKWHEKIVKKLGVKVDEHEWDVVAGSRKVIKDPNNPDQNSFYTKDIWTDYLDRIKDIIPHQWVIYGELIGWVDETTPIQTNFTYDQAPGTNQLYIYRIATVNEKGLTVDLSWDQVKTFCWNNGLKYVPELWVGKHKDFNPDTWIDVRLADSWEYRSWGGSQPLHLSDNKLPDEGVCIRAEGLTPYILKAKSSGFLAHETKLLDKNIVDIETLESENA